MANYYRVDKRLFGVGETVRTAGEFSARFGDVAKAIEDALEAARPTAMTKRSDCLFLFESFDAARKHWSKMTGGKLYRIEIGEAPICHRADMTIMDTMKDAPDGDWELHARRYWAGEMSEAPEIEVLVIEAEVVEVLSTSEDDRRAHLKARWRLAF